MSDYDDLLKPSLAEAGAATQLYSRSALFWVAFLGGGFAVIPMAYENSKILRRTDVDKTFFIVVGIVFTCALLGIMAAAFSGLFITSFGALRTARYLSRAAALGAWGAVAFRHRPFHRTSEMSGLEGLPALKPGIKFGAIGIAIQGVLVLAVYLLFGGPE